jgi:class 3 adenylate cyclase/tetratricopeptide (TPR) repeat protein
VRAGRAAPWSEELEGSLLVADMAGFTRLADRVAERGRLGTEQLVGILNRYYARILKPVFRYEGQPFRFGGDSLVALFSGRHHAEMAAACASAIHTELARTALLPSSAGGGRIRVSQGIASGKLTLLCAAPADKTAAFLLLGQTVGDAVRAQDAAAAGETLLASSTASRLGLEGETTPEGFLPCPSLPQPRSAERSRHQRPPERFAARFLDPTLAERLGVEGGANAGEHRRIAVLFVQIDGLHELCATGVEGVRAIEEMSARVASEVIAGGGVLLGADPTPSGAKFLAVFGLDRVSEHDTERAALAALALCRTLRSLRPSLAWKIGLNAGTVLASELGAQRRRDYTVLGDPINVAARLAAGAPLHTAVAHGALENEIRPAVRLGALPAAIAKGKAAPLPRVRLVDRRRTPLSSLAPPVEEIVGRAEEAERLRRLEREAAETRTARAALVSGPAGTGKSVLIALLAREWEERGGRALLLDRRRVGGVPGPYAVWRGPLRALLGVRRGETASLPALGAVVERWALEDRDALALLARLLGVPFAGDALASLDPPLLADRLRRVAVSALAAAARDQRLLVAVDDLAALDDASADLLQALVRRRADAPLVVLAGARTDTSDLPWDETVALGGLHGRELEQAVAQALGAASLDPRVLGFLEARTAGNPLFAISLAHEALADGLIAVSPGTRTCVPIADLAALSAPSSLVGLLQAGVDALAPADRGLMQAAAVCGQRFAPALLAAAGAAQADLLDRAIDRLTVGDLLQRDADGWLSFRRPLLREAVYDALPSARKRRMHGRIADALLRDWATGDEDVLAEHLIAAEDPRLVPFALRAGARAQELADGEAALRAYRAIYAGPRRVRDADPAATLVSLVAAGDVLVHHVSRYAEALGCYERALRRAGRHTLSADTPDVLSIRYKLGYALRRLGRDEAAARALRRVLRDGRGTPSAMAASALLEIAMIRHVAGASGPALRLCRRALAVAEAAGAAVERAHAYIRLGIALSHTGDHVHAVDFLQRGVELCRDLGDVRWQADGMNNLGAVLFRLGRLDDAAAAYQAARDLWRSSDDADRTAQAAINLGEVLALRGQFDEAQRLFSDCRARWERSGYAIGVANADLFAGQTHARQGNWTAAREELRRAADQALALGLDGLTAFAEASLAEALYDAGRRSAARQTAESAAARGARARSRLYDAYVQRALGVASGATDAGRRRLADAIAVFARQDMAFEEAVTRLRLAEALILMADAEAVRHAEAALETFSRLGTAPERERATRLLERWRASAPRDRELLAAGQGQRAP